MATPTPAQPSGPGACLPHHIPPLSRHAPQLCTCRQRPAPVPIAVCCRVLCCAVLCCAVLCWAPGMSASAATRLAAPTRPLIPCLTHPHVGGPDGVPRTLPRRHASLIHSLAWQTSLRAWGATETGAVPLIACQYRHANRRAPQLPHACMAPCAQGASMRTASPTRWTALAAAGDVPRSCAS